MTSVLRLGVYRERIEKYSGMRTNAEPRNVEHQEGGGVPQQHPSSVAKRPPNLNGVDNGVSIRKKGDICNSNHDPDIISSI